MLDIYKIRRVAVAVISIFVYISIIITNTPVQITSNQIKPIKIYDNKSSSALIELKKLSIKGRAPKTGYTRAQFGTDWNKINGCDTRNIILNRDLQNVIVDDLCNVISGTLNDPYTGKFIQFKRGSNTSGDVQIDHVVAISDAWQKGAQQLTANKRNELANDPIELLAVSKTANLQKSDGDAATWLPLNKSFRCQYVARQIAVKQKYSLWITQAEFDAMERVLNNCPDQLLPSP